MCVCVCVCVYSKILFRHKKEKIMPFVATWMGLDMIILRDVSNTEKDKSFDITYIWNLKSIIYMNLFAKQKSLTRFRKKIYCYQREKVEGG